jgi:competence protein ComEC
MLATHKGEIPFFIMLLPFLAGIAFGWYQSSSFLIHVLISIFCILSALFIFLNVNYQRLRLYKQQWLGGLLIHLLLITLGWLSVCSYNELNRKDHFSYQTADHLLVRISNEPVISGQYFRFTASVITANHNGKLTKASGNLLITLKDSGTKTLYYGDELVIPPNYQPVEPRYVPAEFNYKQYLANQNIHYQYFLLPNQYVRVAQNTGNPVVAYALRLRERLVAKFKANLHDSNAIAVASTLILGYKADLSNDVLQAYSKTGTIHVLSVSGAHVAILYVLLNLALKFMDGYRHGKTVKAILVILLIWCYALLSGFSPAVCRAALMISLVITGKTWSRTINTLNILALSAFILLLYDPFFIADVGFQLSYLAVFGLIVFQPLVYRLWDFKNKWLDQLWTLLSVSIAAQVITFPLSVFYFHQFPVYFLLSNLLIIIPSAVIMYSGMVLLLLPKIPVISAVLAFILEKSILTMNAALAWIEHAPFSGITKIWLTNVEYLLLYIVIISLVYFLYIRKIFALQISLVSLLIFCLLISYKKYNQLNTDSIAFLNLKKHTGIVIKHGSRAAVLTDLNDTDKIYKYAIQPYLDSCQIEAISKTDLTHDLNTGYLRKKGSLMAFDKKILLVIDKKISLATLSRKLNTDFIFVTGNPKTNLNEINQHLSYRYLVINADNIPKFTAGMEQQAIRQKIKYTNLKRNISVILRSN